MSAIEMLHGQRWVQRTATAIVLGLSLFCWGSLSLGQSLRDPEAIEEARQLEEDEQPQAAFLKYLSVPGGEFAAVTLARPQAREFLKLLAEQGRTIPMAR